MSHRITATAKQFPLARAIVVCGLLWAATAHAWERPQRLPPVTEIGTPARRNITPDQSLVSALLAAHHLSGVESAPAGSSDWKQISSDRHWQWQAFPDGLIYRSYLAGVKEPRLGVQWFDEWQEGWLHEATLGARVGIVRYGTTNPIAPEGWQLDFEGAAMPRIEAGSLDVLTTDFRYGLWLTRGRGAHRTKFGFYHLSAHLADEFMVRHPDVERINFLRDVLVLGHSYFWTEDLRLYAEAGFGFRVDDGSEPWEFQFGMDYSPARVTGFWPDLFIAINGHLREELDFGGNLSLQTGLQWRGDTGNLCRFGMHYYSGKSSQYQFFDRFEDQLGMGVWYDF
jgi:hypothetical protein